MPHTTSFVAADASGRTVSNGNNHATAPPTATPQPQQAHGIRVITPTLDMESLMPVADANSTTTAHVVIPAAPPLTTVLTPGKRAQTAPAPFLKYGYLFKQSAGKWKRKRWNQRWFVLDSETGLLKYFRHASLPEAVHFRQDAHGALQLQEKGVSLVIQGDLPRSVPTPFCFTVSGASSSREIRICADTNQEFKEWTNAISLVMSPREVTESEDQDDHDGDSSVLNSATDDSTRPSARINGNARDSSASSSSSGPPSPSRGDDDESMSDTDELAASPPVRRGGGTNNNPHAMPMHRTFGIFPSNMVRGPNNLICWEFVS